MWSRLVAGAVASVLAGIVFGAMMQMMTAPTPEGGKVSVIVMIAMILRSDNPIVGWAFHLVVSAFFGAIFGLALDNRVSNYREGAVWGAGYGAFWWVFGGLIAMPVLLGMAPFSSLRMPPMRPVALGSLVGHLIWGVILAEIYVRLRRPRIAAQGTRRVA